MVLSPGEPPRPYQHILSAQCKKAIHPWFSSKAISKLNTASHHFTLQSQWGLARVVLPWSRRLVELVALGVQIARGVQDLATLKGRTG